TNPLTNTTYHGIQLADQSIASDNAIKTANADGIALYSCHTKRNLQISEYIAQMEDVHQSIRFLDEHSGEINELADLAECFPNAQLAKQFVDAQKQEQANAIIAAKQRIIDSLGSIIDIIDKCLNIDQHRE